MRNEEKQPSSVINKIFAFVVFLVIVYGVDLLGFLSIKQTLGSWFQSIQKPSFEPPGFVFGPVWTVLYFLIALAGYLLWRSPKNKKRRRAFLFWVLQLIANGLWPFFFFYLKMPILGLIDLLVLILLVISAVISSYQVSRWASLCLWPYFLWLLYAVILNWGIVVLNR